jgi:hypothetical protein
MGPGLWQTSIDYFSDARFFKNPDDEAQMGK